MEWKWLKRVTCIPNDYYELTGGNSIRDVAGFSRQLFEVLRPDLKLQPGEQVPIEVMDGRIERKKVMPLDKLTLYIRELTWDGGLSACSKAIAREFPDECAKVRAAVEQLIREAKGE